MLGLFLGVDLYSVTLIVVAFMTGLGFGNFAGGYIADRLSRRNNLIAFGIAELLIGIFAYLSKGIFYDVLYSQQHILLQTSWVMIALLFATLLWPTFFMGMSLPCLARATTKSEGEATKHISILYGINTFGSSIGALVTTLFFFRLMSMEAILILGAGVNVLVAVAALLLARYAIMVDSQHTTVLSRTQFQHTSAISFGAWVLLSALTGYIGLSLEIVWFRVLGIALKNTSFTFGILLAIYLSALGIGSLLGWRGASRTDSPERKFLEFQAGAIVYVVGFIIICVSLLNDYGPLSYLWEYFRSSETNHSNTDAIQILRYWLFPILLIGPPALWMGIAFAYIQKAVHNDIVYIGRRVGWLQTANIAGSICGVLLTSVISLNLIGVSGTLRMLTIIGGIPIIIWCAIAIKSNRRNLAMVISVVVLVVLAWSIPSTRNLWLKFHGAYDAETLEVAEDATGVTLLRTNTSNDGQWIIMYANGRIASWVPFASTHSMLGILPLLLHSNPEDIAIIGLGSGGTVFHVGGNHKTKTITNIEIVNSERTTIESLNEYYNYPALSSVLSDPRIHYISDDARVYLMRSKKKYDIIEADALWPDSAHSGSLYSIEYFTLLKSKLRPGGIAVTWCPTQRTLDTFLRVFPHVITIGKFAFGSIELIVLDEDSIDRLFAHPFTKSYYEKTNKDVKNAVREYIRNHNVVNYGPDFDRSNILDVNTDLFPKDEFSVVAY